jgi:pantetheine-phosphate adenylyltransferase
MTKAKRIAVYAGSFDPITLGHIDIIERALPMFDRLCVAIGNNPQKTPMFSIEDRLEFMEMSLKTKRCDQEMRPLSIDVFSGLLIDFCDKIGANYIVRGLRNETDFAYEISIAQANMRSGNIETIFLPANPKLSFISSSIVRAFMKYGRVNDKGLSVYLESEVALELFSRTWERKEEKTKRPKVCTTPTGRTDCHFKYVRWDKKNVMVCMFCGKNK